MQLGLTSTSDRKSSYQVVAVIVCSYSTSPGCGAEEVIMPNMEWHFYRNDKLINFDLTSTPAVTKSKEGSWIHTVIQPGNYLYCPLVGSVYIMSCRYREKDSTG